MDGPKPNDIARCLNALALMNMKHIASADIISDLVNDYFIIRPIGNDDNNSDLCEFVEVFATSCVLIINLHFCQQTPMTFDL